MPFKLSQQFGFSNVDINTFTQATWDQYPLGSLKNTFTIGGNTLKPSQNIHKVYRGYLAYRVAIFLVYTFFFRYYIFDVRRAWAQFTQFSYLGTLLLDIQLFLLLALILFDYYRERKHGYSVAAQRYLWCN